MASDMTAETKTSGSLRVLLVADEEFRGEEFMNEVKRHIDGRSAEVSVFVTAPALAGSGIEHEMADFDSAIEEAKVRLENVLAELKGVGIEAVGHVGDGDVVVAIGDGLREFEADEIIVVAHDESSRAYGEKDLWKNIEHEFHQPLVELIVDSSGDGKPVVTDVHRDGGRAVTEEEEIEATRNFPPLTGRDITGILVGFFGTIILILLSANAGVVDGGDINGAAAAILLLTIGAFLLNIANIIGLLFFQSVRYTGVWEKFMARSAMLYTIGAIVLALIFRATI